MVSEAIGGGAEEQYDSFINQIRFEELKGNICIKGIISDDKCRKSFDGYDVLIRLLIKRFL